MEDAESGRNAMAAGALVGGMQMKSDFLPDFLRAGAVWIPPRLRTLLDEKYDAGESSLGGSVCQEMDADLPRRVILHLDLDCF